MTVPAVQNFDTSRIPVEGTASFRADASYVWSTIPNVINSLNTSIVVINSIATQITSDGASATTAKNTAITQANQASNSASAALGAEQRIKEIVPITGISYSTEATDAKISAALPYSGYTQVNKKLDNFVFEEAVGFEYKVADENRFVKFLDVVVDTHAHASFDATKGGVIADFASTMPDVVEIITDGSNTTSVTVNAGDYVLDGRPVQYFESFDTSLGDFVDVSSGTGTVELNSGSITLSRTSSSDIGKIASVETYIEDEVVYNFSIEIISMSGTGVNLINAKDFTTTLGSNSTLGLWEGYCTVRYSNAPLGIFPFTNGTVEIGKVDLYIKSYIFRAKKDTPIGASLSDVTYFEDRTQIGVTNQAIAYHTWNTLTKAYEGIKTEVLFVDASADDILHQDNLMANNGFSKVNDFLWSKGDYLVVPALLWQPLSKGAYHPVSNPFGAKASTDGLGNHRVWYASDAIELKNIVDCMSVGTFPRGSGDIDSLDGSNAWDGTSNSPVRPDSKYYDIVYSDQVIDLRNYAKIATSHEIALITKDKEINGVKDRNGLSSDTSLSVENLTGTAQTIFPMTDKATLVHEVLKSIDLGVTWTSIAFTHQAIENTVTVVASDLIKVSYTSKNLPYIQTIPKPVVYVESKVVTSNSHSIYNDAMKIAQISGKVATGDGTNGFESKFLENTAINYFPVVVGGVYSIKYGQTALNTIDNTFITNYKSSGDVYNEIWTSNYSSLFLSNYGWTIEGNFITPKHNPITIDGQLSSASKYFNVIEEDTNNTYAGMYGTELIYDVDFGDDLNEFEQLTNGTITDTNGNTARTFHGSIPLNIKVK